ncbi:hypothetical protein [Anabaena azotica]|uniref:Uncharacterized protein n=1 Tax=Anabaena azotica FACHB-119 TaxID=947527 RepID=A0ABR8D903_9NOST|nr:hypothetical protein [Anabaena azotica]MBD2503134.1 hypothetical protein [Anabaena azotica FACHB-119]
MNTNYDDARLALDALGMGGLQWKIRQPVTDENSQAIYNEIDYLIRELERVKEQLLPFTLNQLLASYIQQVLVIKDDLSPSQARQIVNNLLTKNFPITDEKIISELILMNQATMS